MPYCEYGATRCFGVSKGADVVDNQAYLLFGRLQFPYFDVENVIEAGWAAIFGPGVFIPETPPGRAGNDEHFGCPIGHNSRREGC